MSSIASIICCFELVETLSNFVQRNLIPSVTLFVKILSNRHVVFAKVVQRKVLRIFLFAGDSFVHKHVRK